MLWVCGFDGEFVCGWFELWFACCSGCFVLRCLICFILVGRFVWP